MTGAAVQFPFVIGDSAVSPANLSPIVPFIEEFASDDWPDKLPDDLEYAHVAIAAETYTEAVTMNIAIILKAN